MSTEINFGAWSAVRAPAPSAHNAILAIAPTQAALSAFSTTAEPLWTTAVSPAAGTRSGLAGPLPRPASPPLEPPGVSAPAPPDDKPAPWREVWAGADLIENAWTAYSGISVAPFGALAENGWRIRSVAGYGRYSYEGARVVGKTVVPLRHHATKSFADLLVGYQQGFGPLTLKGFVGIAGRADQTSPLDAANPTEGMKYGARVELDAWLEISPTFWASATVYYASLHETVGARTRFGARVSPPFSVGLEAAFTHDVADDTGRLGAFARYAWDIGEISIAGGINGPISASLTDRSSDSAYLSVNWLTKF